MEQKNYKITKAKDIILFSLLVIWIIIPILKMIRATSLMTEIYEYKFMEVVGLVGIYLLVLTIYKKILKSDNKKQLVKDLLPLIFFIGYLIWTLFACIFANNTQNAFYGDRYRQEGFITYLIYAGFFSCAFLISSDKLKRCLLNLFILVAIINILLIYIINNNIQLQQLINYREIQVGVFCNRNHYGYYLLLATIISDLFFILEKNKLMKVFYGLAYIILQYILIINNTFGCYLAFLVTIILFFIYCIYRKKYQVLSFVSIIVFVLMSMVVTYNGKNVVLNNMQDFYNDIDSILDVTKYKISNMDKDVNESSDNTITRDQNSEDQIIASEKQFESAGSGRGKLWKYGIKIFLKNPILGYGADNLREEYEKYDIEQDRPHNLIIQLATTSGLPGLIFYIAGVGLILVRGFKKMNDSKIICTVVFFALISYLISAMFGNSMYYTSPYFFIFLGVLYNQVMIKQNNINNEKI